MEADNQPVNPPLATEVPVQELMVAKPSSPKMLYGVVGIILIAALFVGGYFFITRKATDDANNATVSVAQPSTQPQTNNVSTTFTPTPTAVPITTSNEDVTLNNTDASMQQATSQVNSDLGDLNKINVSQDNPNGL